jgi:hypothetical protein
MRISIWKPAVAGILFLSMFSCIKKEKYEGIGVEPWQPDLAVPVINGTLELKDLAENIDKSQVNVIEDQDGLYILVYKDTLESEKAEDLIKIPDQQFSKVYGVPSLPEIAFPNKTTEKVFQESYQFTMSNGEKLKYADLKGGNLVLTSNSGFNTNLNITVTFSSLISNTTGQPLKTIFSVKKGVNTLPPISLAGYTLDLDGADGTKINTLEYQVKVAFSTGSAGETAGVVDVDFSMENLKYKTLYGNLGTYNFPPTAGTVNIDIFENVEHGEIIFNDPRIILNFENSFGVPSSFRFTQFETVTDNNQVEKISNTNNNPGTLNTNGGPNVLNAPANIGQVAYTTYEVNATNSTIVKAFEHAPSMLNYSVIPSIISGTGINHFITDNSRIKVYATAEIPLDARIKVYTLTDTIKDIDLPDDDFIQQATIKIKTTNSLPVDAYVQGYWLDEKGKILDTLIVPAKDLLVSGQINQDGIVVAPTEQYIEITYNKARYDKIKNATMLKIEGNMETSKAGTVPVKFYSHNHIRIQVAVNVKGKVEF